MNYLKPEVSTLGNASAVIETLQIKNSSPTDNVQSAGPAYDLDE